MTVAHQSLSYPDLRSPRMNDGTDHGNHDSDGEDQNESSVLLKTRPKTKKPSMYKVLLLNDDYLISLPSEGPFD